MTVTPDTTTPTDLSTLVEALKRELAVPGTFATVFPDTQDTDLSGSLADAFAQAQLDGFFSTSMVDLSTPATPQVSPPLSSGGGALVILYAAERTIRAQLRVLKTTFKVEGGPGISYEADQAASILVQELKDLTARRTSLLALLLRQQRSSQAVHVTDGYLLRAQPYYPANYFGEFGTFYSFEMLGWR